MPENGNGRDSNGYLAKYIDLIKSQMEQYHNGFMQSMSDYSDTKERVAKLEYYVKLLQTLENDLKEFKKEVGSKIGKLDDRVVQNQHEVEIVNLTTGQKLKQYGPIAGLGAIGVKLIEMLLKILEEFIKNGGF